MSKDAAKKESLELFPAAESGRLFRFIHISDTHLRSDGSFTGELIRVIEQINLAGADFVIHTGDIADEGAIGGLERFMKLAAGLKVPVRCVRGNHELEGEAGRESGLYQRLIGQPLYYSFQHRGFRFIGLDTAAAQHMGAISPEQLDWLENELKAAGRSAFIFAHVPLRREWEQGAHRWYITENGERLAALLEERPPVAFLAGHLHWTNAFTRSGPTLHSTAPSLGGLYNYPNRNGYLVWDVYPDRIVQYYKYLYLPWEPSVRNVVKLNGSDGTSTR
ncbi:MAG: 3',5'-cyclic adenosine monophosphate phosphodiesterase CpdA [candidate division TA06 bacterium ADurb.Bin417]|uniref:3',5'-cyclic adenosine monophosphate phosphodiesterase CpdA n=1 Tax=candidate division TA06 bacterium ADurb.Bin417 TaxID=1852828 RepID=A0A1V5MHR4_UNCT6|nr:MAG: 3',5'-cyclic adenosine monophosphate phosphodiesterase CpdA [candidate division TA06 bacterium ADurb.Bin417]